MILPARVNSTRLFADPFVLTMVATPWSSIYWVSRLPLITSSQEGWTGSGIIPLPRYTASSTWMLGAKLLVVFPVISQYSPIFGERELDPSVSLKKMDQVGS